MKINAQSYYFLFLLTAAFGAACSSEPAPATNANSNRAVVTDTNTVNINTAAPSPSASVTPANTTTGSPAATVVAYQQAMFKKDEAAFRKAISEASAREISPDATAEKKSLVVFWTELSEVTQPTVETRNERINGAVAYIEVKNPRTGEWSMNKLVRENNEWKMDLTNAATQELINMKPQK